MTAKESDHIQALEEARRAFSAPRASSAALGAAAEAARGVVRAIDRLKSSEAQRMEAALSGLKAGASLTATRTALRQIKDDERVLESDRAIATWLAAAIDARAHEAKKAEAARDEKRKPFATQTRRAEDLAARFAEAPALFKRVRDLIKADLVIEHLGEGMWKRARPRPTTQSIAYEFNPKGLVPRLLATPEALATIRLPGFTSRDFETIEQRIYYPDQDLEVFGEVVAAAVDELRKLLEKHDRRQIVVTDETVIHAVGRAQAVLLGEYNKTWNAIRELLALDAGLTPHDLAARYPDGAPIFDTATFPAEWRLGRMSLPFNGCPYVNLPRVDGAALAAE